MYTILVCDDEKDIVSAIEIYLSTEGYRILTAGNGAEALEILGKETVHLVLMDIMMPVMDGISATAKIRRESNVPILFLTAKSESSDKILGLGIGADDYITKPFDPMELVARVRSHLRRYTTLGSMDKPADVLVNGGIELDDGAKKVTVDGEEISLTPIEYSMLRMFMQHPGQVFSIRQIYEQVWNETAIGNENAVAVHIRHLREKTEINPSEPRYIKVVWGLGYKMEKKEGHDS
ncbi:MAG: response regulator transcription factor [Clostridia bacterium]|nr:response regulator transcription factor [Clostridia bacterium]